MSASPHVPAIGKLRAANAEANFAARVPTRFRDALTTHPEIDKWARRLADDPPTAGNLVILGPTGVGKTHAAYGAVRTASVRRCSDGFLCTWRATSHSRLIADLRPGHEGCEIEARECAQAELLLIDDLGAARQTPWSDEQLLMIVDERWAHGRPTIATSNLDPDALLAAVGSRIVSRLTGGATVVILDGHDQRMSENHQPNL